MDFFLQLVATGLAVGMLYGFMAAAIVAIIKSSGVFNFAHASIVVLGASVFWTLLVQFGLPMWVCIILLFPFSLLLAMVIERLILRPLTGQPLLSVVMATIALGVVIESAQVMIWPGMYRVYQPPVIPPGSIRLGPVSFGTTEVATFLVCLVCLGIFAWIFMRTRMGLAMRAVAEDHQLARAHAIKVERIFLVAWVVAIFAASVCGVLTASIYGVNANISGIGLYAFPAIIFGGLESIRGAVIGGIALGILANLAGGYLDHYVGGGLKEVMPYIIMLLVLMVKPYGLFGYERIERV